MILSGNTPYRCKNVTIFAGTKKFNFHCLRALSKCSETEPTKCFMDIVVSGSIKYEVTIKTGDKPEDGTISPILFTIVGSKGNGQKKLFSL